MDELLAKLNAPLGPLAAWQWGALAGGGLLVFRYLKSGHQTTGVQSVTLTPNNQPDLSGSGTDTIGSAISALNTAGVPSNFSITLPNGTVVTWNGTGFTTVPPAANPAPSTPPVTTPTIPSIGQLTGPNLLPSLRGGPTIPGANPLPLPDVPRWGPVIPGANPNAAPGLPPVVTTVNPFWWVGSGLPAPFIGTNPTPAPAPTRPTSPVATGGNPGATPFLGR